MIAASRDQAPAVAGECQAADESGMAAEGAEQLTAYAVPDFHGAVLTGRGDPPTLGVGAEGDGADVAVVPPEDQEFLGGLHVTDLERVPLVAHHQPLPVWAEGHVQTHTG